jgi:hypothetical protein
MKGVFVMQYVIPAIYADLVRIDSEDDNLLYLKKRPLSDSSISAPINIRLKVGASAWPAPREYNQRFGFFHVCSERDEVYYDFPISLGFKFRMLIRGMSTNTIEFTVSRAYWFMGASLGSSSTGFARIFNLACMKLNSLGYICLHGGFLERNGVGALIVAPSVSGKTATCILGINHGFKFGGDDICVTDGKSIFPANYYNNKKESVYSGLYFAKVKPLSSWRRVVLNGIFSSKLCYLSPRMKEQLMPKIDLAGKLVTTPVSNRYIFFLQKGNRMAEQLPRDEALRRLRLLQAAEFSWSVDSLLLSHSYFNHDAGVDCKKADSVLETLVQNSEPWLITAENPLNYIEVIDTIVR